MSLIQYEDFLIAVGDYECPAGNVVPLVQGRVARAMLGAPAAVVGPAGGNFSNDTAGMNRWVDIVKVGITNTLIRFETSFLNMC